MQSTPVSVFLYIYCTPTWSLCAVYSCYIPIILWFPIYTVSVDTYLLSMCSLLLLYPNNLVVPLYILYLSTPTCSLCAVYSCYIPIILWFLYIYILYLSTPTCSLCAVYSCYIPIILWFPLYILYLSTPTWSLCAVYSCYIPIILWIPLYIYTVSVDTYLISMCSLLLLYPNNPVVPYIYCICRHLLALYVQSTPVISQ